MARYRLAVVWRRGGSNCLKGRERLRETIDRCYNYPSLVLSLSPRNSPLKIKYPGLNKITNGNLYTKKTTRFEIPGYIWQIIVLGGTGGNIARGPFWPPHLPASSLPFHPAPLTHKHMSPGAPHHVPGVVTHRPADRRHARATTGTHTFWFSRSTCGNTHLRRTLARLLLDATVPDYRTQSLIFSDFRPKNCFLHLNNWINLELTLEWSVIVFWGGNSYESEVQKCDALNTIIWHRCRCHGNGYSTRWFVHGYM